jgi:hypothetical protein
MRKGPHPLLFCVTESTHGKLKVLVKLISIYIEGFTVVGVGEWVWKKERKVHSARNKSKRNRKANWCKTIINVSAMSETSFI